MMRDAREVATARERERYVECKWEGEGDGKAEIHQMRCRVSGCLVGSSVVVRRLVYTDVGRRYLQILQWKRQGSGPAINEFRRGKRRTAATSAQVFRLGVQAAGISHERCPCCAANSRSWARKLAMDGLVNRARTGKIVTSVRS